MEFFDKKTFVKVEDYEWTRVLPCAETCCSQAAAAVIAFEDLDNTACEISIVLTDNKMVKNLNREWRGIDSATDVLAFPNQESEPLGELSRLLGDVVVAFGEASRDAELDGVSLHDHLSHLIVHGVFHLLGYDHLDEKEAKIMEANETAVLENLGVSDPYCTRATMPLSELI